MSFDNYIKSMADTCRQVYEEMTGQTVDETATSRIDLPRSAPRFKAAIVIPYENRQDHFEGRFILGFNDELMAAKLADRIAGFAGMPAVDALDDVATDILFEFMNTVAGKVVTEWDKMGLTADFLPPEFVAHLDLDRHPDENLMIYSLTLHLADGERLVILSLLEETNKSPLQGKKVLIVDDSKMIRFMLSSEFRKQGCLVTEAENGLDGFIKQHAVQPDLIIMDLIMPKMGGLDALAKIREINPTVPIIVLTSTSKKGEVMAAVAHKIKGYIRKPIKMDQLLQLARSCFQKDR